jgi:GDPmannose 4,6-dehydratase
VIATGESHSVKEFVELAFEEAGLDWKKYVTQDERFMRPAEVPELKGDATKANKTIGWKPEVTFKELIRMMVEDDIEKYQARV